MAGYIFAAIVWFALIGIGEAILFVMFALGFAKLSEMTGREYLVSLGIILGWASALTWFIFAGYHAVLNTTRVFMYIL